MYMVAYIHHESGNDTPKTHFGTQELTWQHGPGTGFNPRFAGVTLTIPGHYMKIVRFSNVKNSPSTNKSSTLCACVVQQQQQPQQPQQQQQEEEMHPPQKRVPQLQATLFPSLACRMPQDHP
jgi:hypothetical protein